MERWARGKQIKKTPVLLTWREISELELAVLKMILQSCQYSGDAWFLSLCPRHQLYSTFSCQRGTSSSTFSIKIWGKTSFIMTPYCTTQLNLNRSIMKRIDPSRALPKSLLKHLAVQLSLENLSWKREGGGVEISTWFPVERKRWKLQQFRL